MYVCTRLEKQWQSGSVQFKHQLHTGELELDHKFYADFDEAYKERKQEQKQLEDADKEQEDALADQEDREYCQQRPPNDKRDDDQDDDKPKNHLFIPWKSHFPIVSLEVVYPFLLD